MQIHELDLFSGSLDGATYIAGDNGTDTGKIPISSITGPLNERIDNIIAGGDAPSAAEITDARLGADGIVYPSLGDAIRDQIENITDDLYDHFDFDDTAVSYTETTGKLIDGTTRDLIDIAGTNYAVSDIISVTPGDLYVINASMNYGHYLFVFYDSDGTAFGGIKSSSGSGLTTLTDKMIRIPGDAVGLRIGYATSYTHSLAKRTNILVAEALSDSTLEEIRTDLLSPIDDTFKALGLVKITGVNLLDPDDVITNAALDYTNGDVLPSHDVVTGLMEVEEGEKYSAFAYSTQVIGLPVARVVAYNEDESFNSYLGGIAYASSVPNTVTIPAGAKYVRLQIVTDNYTSFGPVMFAKTDGAAMPASIVEYKETAGLTTPGEWIGKKWTAVGDSLTEVNARTSINYLDYISEVTGIEVVNMGESGSGYMRKYDTNHAFYNRVANVPTDSDVVTIFGSLNDLGNSQVLGTINDTVSDGTVFGYVNGTIDALFTAFPMANLGIISPTPWASSQPWNENNASSQYCEGLKQICYNRGIPFLDLYHCSNLRPWDATARSLFYSKDDGNGTHPDEAGHKMFAPKIKNFLESLLL